MFPGAKLVLLLRIA